MDISDEDVFYLGIKTMVISEEGKILLMLRPPSKAGERALWDIPGGRKKRGEAIEESLKRELYEETGLRIAGRDVQFVGPVLGSTRISMGETDAGLVLFVYRCQWDGVPEVRLSPEHSDFWWATPEEAEEALRSRIPPSFLVGWRD
jgi:8-oxo-dGTP diphosphatase